MSRGGPRAGAGRPRKQPTARKAITWRLPVDLLVRIGMRAKANGVTVSEWVETALRESLDKQA